MAVAAVGADKKGGKRRLAPAAMFALLGASLLAACAPVGPQTVEPIVEQANTTEAGATIPSYAELVAEAMGGGFDPESLEPGRAAALEQLRQTFFVREYDTDGDQQLDGPILSELGENTVQWAVDGVTPYLAGEAINEVYGGGTDTALLVSGFRPGEPLVVSVAGANAELEKQGVPANGKYLVVMSPTQAVVTDERSNPVAEVGADGVWWVVEAVAVVTEVIMTEVPTETPEPTQEPTAEPTAILAPVIGEVSVLDGKLMVQTEVGLEEAGYADIIDTEAGVFRYVNAATGSLVEVPLNPVVEGTMVRAFEEDRESPNSSGLVIDEEAMREAYRILQEALKKRETVNPDGTYNYDIYLKSQFGTYFSGLGPIILNHSNAYLEGDLEGQVKEQGLVFDGARIVTATYEQYSQNENGVATFIESVIENGGAFGLGDNGSVMIGWGITPDRMLTLCFYSKYNDFVSEAPPSYREYMLRAVNLNENTISNNADVVNTLFLSYLAMIKGGVFPDRANPIYPWLDSAYSSFHVKGDEYFPHDGNFGRLSGLPRNPQVFYPDPNPWANR